MLKNATACIEFKPPKEKQKANFHYANNTTMMLLTSDMFILHVQII